MQFLLLTQRVKDFERWLELVDLGKVDVFEFEEVHILDVGDLLWDFEGLLDVFEFDVESGDFDGFSDEIVKVLQFVFKE